MRVSLLAFALLAACADAAAPPAPDYDPPSGARAKPAFKAAFADIVKYLNDQPDIEMPDEINAVTSVKMRMANEQQIARKDAATAAKAIQKMDITECAWVGVRDSDVPKWEKERVGETPAGAYHCQFTAHYQINPPHGKNLSSSGEGYFYRNGGDYIYFGAYPHPY
jgi:hypothetical protein